MHGVVAFALYDWSYFFAQLVAGLTLGSLYALIALGYSMVYGILKLLNFAHGDVYMIGVVHRLLHADRPRRAPDPGVPIGGADLRSCSRRDDRLRGARRRHRAVRVPAAAERAPRIAPLISALGVSFFLQQTGRASASDPIPKQYNTYSLQRRQLFNSDLDRAVRASSTCSSS